MHCKYRSARSNCDEALFVNRVLDAVALLLTAGLLHVWMVSLDIREAQAHLLQEQNRKLEVANDLLIARESQIVRQNEELIRRRLEAEDASGRKTRLLNAVSHDIRNPVNTINLMAEVIRRTAEDPALVTQVPRMARRLQSNARSLVALVSEVLDTAHLDSGLLQRRDSTFSLNEFIDAARRDLAPLAEAKLLHLNADDARTNHLRPDGPDQARSHHHESGDERDQVHDQRQRDHKRRTPSTAPA